MDLVTVKTFDSYFLANIILGRLQAEGIECYLKDETTVTMDPILTNAIGGIKLVVKSDQADAVKAILKVTMRNILTRQPAPGAAPTSLVMLPNLA
jgi:hypothetical protein